MKIRYGVVGLGHIAQTAVLPAFRNAKSHAELTALVSGSSLKLERLSKRYRVENTFFYDEFEELILSDLVDALYICLPNHMHEEFTIRALEQGIHVLCEKPLSLSSRSCLRMIDASESTGAKLMTAYRLHFDPANLKAIELANSGKIGEMRYFNSSFSFVIKDKNNIRLRSATGGGPLWDIGIYCINAARNIFKSEPHEVMAIPASQNSRTFAEVDEMVGAILKFPDDRIANFVCSFGAYDACEFKVLGTKGSLSLENAYEYSSERKLLLDSEDGRQQFRFPKTDQFAPELIYFSESLTSRKKLEPSGYEGLADIAVVEALYRSCESGQAERVENFVDIKRKPRPTMRQKIIRPGIPKVSDQVAVRSPSGD